MSPVEITAQPVATDESESYSEKGGVFWYSDCGLKVRDVARAMNAICARFITITTYELPANGGFRLEYHWDLMGHLLGFTFPLEASTIENVSIESIYDLCEAADWIEREVHEEYRIDFTGREYEPLLLRQGGVCGVNLQKEIVQ